MLQKLPELPYDYQDLEPVISKEIMELHHKKHHQAYINNYNATLEKYQGAEKKGDLSSMLSFEPALKFNGGGHVNHTLFWEGLCPANKAKKEPSGNMKKEIEKEFSSFLKFQELFVQKTVAIQGSGWGWLGFNPVSGKLQIATCQNQDPLSLQGLIPLFGVDVWEHAYYLQYKNLRPDYVKAIWQIVHWDVVEKRYEKALASK